MNTITLNAAINDANRNIIPASDLVVLRHESDSGLIRCRNKAKTLTGLFADMGEGVYYNVTGWVRTAKRHYYCVSYGMGLAVSANTGDRYAAAYHSFDSADERDEYVSEGGDFRTSNDWRESLPASDRELKAAISDKSIIICRA